MELSYELHLPPGDTERHLPPILLLHGMFDSRKTWKSIAPELARQTGRKVYCLDARNHGESPWRDDMTFDILADDLDDFLTRHNIHRAVLVGHSMGGRTALTLALKKAEKVEKLVVEDMSLKVFRPVTGGVFMHLIQLLKDSLEIIPPGADETAAKQAIVEHFMSFFSQGGGPKVSYDLSTMPLKRDSKGQYSWQANLDALHHFLVTSKIQQKLSGVYMGDALFLYGNKSPFKVDKDQTIAKFFPRSTKLGFEKASHLVHFEYPSRFISKVSNFINCSSVQSKY